MKVEVGIENPDAWLRPDMSVRIAFLHDAKPAAIPSSDLVGDCSRQFAMSPCIDVVIEKEAIRIVEDFRRVEYLGLRPAEVPQFRWESAANRTLNSGELDRQPELSRMLNLFLSRRLRYRARIFAKSRASCSTLLARSCSGFL